ncbi:MAG: hypothetical protein RAP03_15280 [Candidatus Electryonea clarkiae]|nr:hypothetical protein [Candidatus Electryonea clarkiae]
MKDEYNEHDEELEEELEEKFESFEKDFDGMKRAVNEPLNRSQRQAFNREVGSPEGLEEERFVTSDEVEKMVIIDNEQDNNQEFQENIISEETEDDISFEKLNSDGSYEEITDNELGSEYFENYDQPEMVREWEASSPSELEGILTPDAIEELKGSMEVIGGLHAIGEVLEESIPEELIDDSEIDIELDKGSGNII